MIISNNSPSVKAKLAFSAEKRIIARLCSSFCRARSLQTAENPLYFCYYSDDRDSPGFMFIHKSEPRTVQGGCGEKPVGITRERARQRRRPSNARRIPRVKGFLSGRLSAAKQGGTAQSRNFVLFVPLFRDGELFFYPFSRASRMIPFFRHTEQGERTKCTKKYRAS